MPGSTPPLGGRRSLESRGCPPHPIRMRCAAPSKAMSITVNICIFICMSSRNIAVQEVVFEALLKEKRPGESFTSLFRRLLEQRGGIEEIAGAWGPGGRRPREQLRELRKDVRGGRR